ncbi:2-oxo-4-hydroxy-4-carboxy-5-ureidoimidazoline decarboxylase [Malassezia pachydermatis]|uniref:2-oxo-4-hydroxy-4-carboxy-5-ureidoimidazoline decarboxylase n=1 Tax=Malassezia pachydermatis TaxID=77020 RepID=A0A0M8MVD0_9BASI|nr:hypothetical protein Malapachy_0694 [Malassezia pachydermatis]KOS15084.1 hypothetical protein Malapachy_0694 [Malassezia pachydermatis]
MSPPPSLDLAWFHALPDDQLVPILQDVFASAPLAVQVASGRPYISIEALCAYATKALYALPHGEIFASVNAHPDIGARVASGSLSEKEQSTAATSDASTMQQIRALSSTYRARFGFTFLIKAAGLSGEEILAALERRLENDRATEERHAMENLAAINALRLHGIGTTS